MQRVAFALALALALACGLALVPGCGREDDDRPYDLDYLTAQIFAPSCGATQCHSQYSRQSGVVMDTPEHVRESVVRKQLVTFDSAAYDPAAPEGSKMNIWLTQIQPGGDGTFRMPLDAPLPNKDLQLILTWIRGKDAQPAACLGADPPLGGCGYGDGKGAQCDPGEFDGLGCADDQVKTCRDDWNFGDVMKTCKLGCIAVPRKEFPDPNDLEQRWCRNVCPDNVVDGPEECDDGNINDGDGCSHLCKVE